MTHEFTPPEPTNAYRRNGYDWPYGDADDVAVPVSKRLAVLPDGIFLRLNPPDQPRVEDVFHKGSQITADHRVDGHVSEVYRVVETETYGVRAYTLLVGEPGKETRDDGLPKRYRGGNIKELVYQDGAVRKLFLENTKEIQTAEERQSDGYQSGFGEWAN